MNPPAHPVSCPKCSTGRAELLTGVSAEAHVWYYRCPDCAQVWSVPKPDRSQPLMPSAPANPLNDSEAIS